MDIISREYRCGDEVQINNLYKLITNIDRNIEEYNWEWIHTWDGQGSIWLMFDAERGEDEQLIAQYSLIPTPLSVWGESYLAGKTENCMSHPDYRGKGIYFPHEKKYFEEAKKRFQIFFTTAGGSSGGAPGFVRRKLGYVAFDSWKRYVYCLNSNYLNQQLHSRLPNRQGVLSAILMGVTWVASLAFMMYYKLLPNQQDQYTVKHYEKKNVPLNEIEEIWTRNKNHYGVTIDRTVVYLQWRINMNPYFDYQYLLFYKERTLVGYVIFHISERNTISVDDILAENCDEEIFKNMIRHLIAYACIEKIDAIICTTLKENSILRKAFRGNRFIEVGSEGVLSKKNKMKPFHVYISKDLKVLDKALKPENWYVTDLFREGRPR